MGDHQTFPYSLTLFLLQCPLHMLQSTLHTSTQSMYNQLRNHFDNIRNIISYKVCMYNTFLPGGLGQISIYQDIRECYSFPQQIRVPRILHLHAPLRRRGLWCLSSFRLHTAANIRRSQMDSIHSELHIT